MSHRPNAKMKLYIVIAIVLALGLTAFYIQTHTPQTTVTPIVTPVVTPQNEGDTANLVSFSIAPGAKLSGEITATGSLKGAYFFEATARGMLLDAGKNTLKSFQVKATSDWMTVDPVTFSATFDTTGISGSGYIRLANDNAMGDPSNDKFIDIPVVFQ